MNSFRPSNRYITINQVGMTTTQKDHLKTSGANSYIFVNAVVYSIQIAKPIWHSFHIM